MPTPQTECLVIPLTNQSQPYKAHLTRTDPTKNCLVYNLEQLRAKQPSFSSHRLMNWQQILAAHLKTEAKLMLINMGEFGVGAFAKNKIIARDLIIYPGQLIDTTLERNLGIAERIYFLHIAGENELHVDAKYTECIAKYFQHLPVRDANAITDFDGEIPAYENFGSNCAYVKIYCDNESFIVPIRVFLARNDICPNTMVGFDYGKQYWHYLKREFTYFTAKGKPIPCHMLYSNTAKYQLSQSEYTSFLNHGFCINAKRMLFLPRVVRETLDELPPLLYEGTASHVVPAIVEINLKNCNILYDATQKEAKAILIKVPCQVTRIRLIPALLSFSAMREFPIPAPIPPVSIRKLLNASIKELSRFAEALNNFMTSPLLLNVEPGADLTDKRVLIFSCIKQGLFKEGIKTEFSRAECLAVTQRRMTLSP